MQKRWRMWSRTVHIENLFISVLRFRSVDWPIDSNNIVFLLQFLFVCLSNPFLGFISYERKNHCHWICKKNKKENEKFTWGPNISIFSINLLRFSYDSANSTFFKLLSACDYHCVSFVLLSTLKMGEWVFFYTNVKSLPLKMPSFTCFALEIDSSLAL